MNWNKIKESVKTVNISEFENDKKDQRFEEESNFRFQKLKNASFSAFDYAKDNVKSLWNMIAGVISPETEKKPSETEKKPLDNSVIKEDKFLQNLEFTKRFTESEMNSFDYELLISDLEKIIPETSDKDDKIYLEMLKEIINFNSMTVENSMKEEVIPAANKIEEMLAKYYAILSEKLKNSESLEDIKKLTNRVKVICMVFNNSQKDYFGKKDPNMICQEIPRLELLAKDAQKAIEKKDEQKINNLINYDVPDRISSYENRPYIRLVNFFAYKFNAKENIDLTDKSLLEDKKTKATKYLLSQELIKNDETVDTYLENIGITYNDPKKLSKMTNKKY